jgi:hypothetical protein
MAMKKSAPKKAASKKGDEPVRAGVGKKAVAKSPSNLEKAGSALNKAGKTFSKVMTPDMKGPLTSVGKALGKGGKKLLGEAGKYVSNPPKYIKDKISGSPAPKKDMRRAPKKVIGPQLPAGRSKSAGKSSGQSKPPDREYQGGIGSLKKPTVIPAGYRVIMLMTDPPRYKLVPKPSK